MDFADWLRGKIEERGMTVTQFADAIKEHQPTIQRIVSKETKNPRFKLVKKIEDYFSEKHVLDNDVIIAGVKIDSYEEQLLKVFKRLNESNKDTIMLLANKLHDGQYPDDHLANPTNHKRKKTK